MTGTDLALGVFSTLYSIVLVTVCVYGMHRWGIVILYYLNRHKKPTPAGEFEELPHVTVQLPMFNERAVARRIIEKTCAIDYPKDKLQIQVLDDSTDAMAVRIGSQACDEARARGFDIEYIHRTDRGGFKAGALTNGMKTATGEFITIFDADFVPEPDTLKRSIQHFTDPKVCVVQTRWDHLNRNDSLLTRSQAIFLDGHFAIEHVARNRSERFMSFNGTAGTWRRSAIDDAGGWQHDTLTEDMDLSYRAQLKGWKFVFLPELTAPAELPPEMNAFKAQQFRWTKGGIQVAMKLLPKVMLSKAPLRVKVEAFFHLTCGCVHMCMLAMVLMLFPAMFVNVQGLGSGLPDVWRAMVDMGIFVVATLSATAFYMASQFELSGDWKRGLRYLPALMAIGVGLCVSNTKAILEAFLGKQSEFVRTPKYGDGQLVAIDKPKRKRRSLLPYIEFALGLYMCACVAVSMTDIRQLLATPFLCIFAFGFLYVSILSFQAERAARLAREKAQAETVGSRDI